MAKNNDKIAQLPARFRERGLEIYGSYFWQQIEQTFVSRPITFRVNTIKSNRKEVMDELSSGGFKVKSVSWYRDAFILTNKKQNELEETDLYKKGKIYLQSLASMVPPLVLAPEPGEKVLDLTAAPGSKTSQMAALMELRGELVANDNDEVRFQKLKHNLELLGVTPPLNLPLREGETAMLGDPSSLRRGEGRCLDQQKGEGSVFCTVHNENGHKLCQQFPNYFDKILLDAPCSAEARINLSERRTFGFWNERNIKDHAFVQRQLICGAWEALKPGGTLVYSTCTFAPEENEVQIDKFLESFPEAKIIEIKLDGLQKIEPVLKWKGKELNKQIKKCWRIMPTVEIEGFFVCKIKKI